MNVIKTAAVGASAVTGVVGSALVLAAIAHSVRWGVTGVETFHEPMVLFLIGAAIITFAGMLYGTATGEI